MAEVVSSTLTIHTNEKAESHQTETAAPHPGVVRRLRQTARPAGSEVSGLQRPNGRWQTGQEGSSN